MKIILNQLICATSGQVILTSFLAIFSVTLLLYCQPKTMAIGSLVYVVERATSSIAVIDIDKRKIVKKIKVDANLRHASIVFDRQLKFGYAATRNGKLNRIDLAHQSFADYVETSKNSIGLAISQDSKVVAVSEYKPGGITLVDTTSFQLIQKIPAFTIANNKKVSSRVTGMVDGANNTFICALMDANEIWVLKRKKDSLQYYIAKKIKTQTPNPFDAMITPEGRYYLTGHFSSNLISLVDLWHLKDKARLLRFHNQASARTPIKMPHMESWAATTDKIFVPAAGEKLLYILSGRDFSRLGQIPLIGDPVYAVVHPHQREIWVTFSGTADGKVQVISTEDYKTIATIDAGKKIYHAVFTPKGDKFLVSSNLTNEFLEINPLTKKVVKRIPLDSPSGIFGVWRAFQTGL